MTCNKNVTVPNYFHLILGNGVLSVPAEHQPRRHSTGHINIAELQPNLENLKINQDVSIYFTFYPMIF